MGAKYRQWQRRIGSIQSTIKITRAMELVAASRIVKAQNRLVQARPYAERIQQAIRELAGITEVEHEFPLLKPREEIRSTGLLVVTSDRGLAGAYNSNVIRVATGILRDAEKEGRSNRLHVVGRKGLSYFRFRGYPLASQTTGISDAPRFQDAETLGDRLVKEFIDGEVDEVRIAYTDFRVRVRARAGRDPIAALASLRQHGDLRVDVGVERVGARSAPPRDEGRDRLGRGAHQGVHAHREPRAPGRDHQRDHGGRRRRRGAARA
jgi:ATP synthase F1 gamma subunit